MSSESGKPKSKKPKVGCEWLDNEVFKLISCVEEHSALWDARDAQYRNKHQRTKLWDEMALIEFEGKFSGSELLAKWSNIRIQYRSYASRKPKSGAAAAPPIQWKFYTALQFIGQAECEQTAETESNLILEDDNNFNISTPASRPSSRPSSRQFQNQRFSQTGSSSPSTNSSAAIVAESMMAAVNSFNNANQNDEFEVFGKFLASELRSLNDIAAARRIKTKISRYFFDAVEQEQLNSPSIVILESEIIDSNGKNYQINQEQ